MHLPVVDAVSQTSLILLLLSPISPCSPSAVMSPSPWQVLDIQMKRMNGDVACRQLREAGIRLPIIAATGGEAHAYTTAHMSLHADIMHPHLGWGLAVGNHVLLMLKAVPAVKKGYPESQ